MEDPTKTKVDESFVTNVPKREESRAKRHFEKSEINKVKRWKCKYCLTNYGLTTSTSSLWKHLEHKHKERLSTEDIKQNSGHEIGEKSIKHISKNAENSTPSTPQKLSNKGFALNELMADVPNNHNLNIASEGRKRKIFESDAVESYLIEAMPNKHSVGNDEYPIVPTQANPVLVASSTEVGFLNLVTDIATIQPSQFESFQNRLVENVFLQPSGPYIFPNVNNVDVMRDRILTTQRNKVIDIVGEQCGWKFDMNIYPVFLKNKTYLMLDLIYRNKKQLHQSCFLDCLEMPDKYPTEMLSLMVFRRLCEFRVENRLWQLFIGDSNLRGLAETLRRIFVDNKLTDELNYQTVDFFNHNFTLQAEEHNDCLNDLIGKVDKCVTQLEMLKVNMSALIDELHGKRFDSKCKDFSCISLNENINDIEEQLKHLRISGGNFQKDMTSIRWWFKRHLFLAYHLCNHCYYLCSDIQSYRAIVDDISVKLDHFLNEVQTNDLLYELQLSPEELLKRLKLWQDILLWWRRKSQEYQDLRYTVLNFVSSNDNTSSFTQQFTKISRVDPQLIPKDRWMKYTFWQIWKNFEKNEYAK